MTTESKIPPRPLRHLLSEGVAYEPIIKNGKLIGLFYAGIFHPSSAVIAIPSTADGNYEAGQAKPHPSAEFDPLAVTATSAALHGELKMGRIKEDEGGGTGPRLSAESSRTQDGVPREQLLSGTRGPRGPRTMRLQQREGRRGWRPARQWQRRKPGCPERRQRGMRQSPRQPGGARRETGVSDDHYVQRLRGRGSAPRSGKRQPAWQNR